MKKTNIGIIVCVESSKQAGTDDRYIKTIIKHYYGERNPVKYINMDTKCNFDKPKIKKKIKEMSEGYNIIKVIYVIDLDDCDINQQQKELNDRISNYCEENRFDLVWFYPNIEVVLLDSEVSKNLKTNRAFQYSKNNEVELLDSSYLESKLIRKGYSNLLIIMDKYFQRKK